MLMIAEHPPFNLTESEGTCASQDHVTLGEGVGLRGHVCLYLSAEIHIAELLL